MVLLIKIILPIQSIVALVIALAIGLAVGLTQRPSNPSNQTCYVVERKILNVGTRSYDVKNEAGDQLYEIEGNFPETFNYQNPSSQIPADQFYSLEMSRTLANVFPNYKVNLNDFQIATIDYKINLTKSYEITHGSDVFESSQDLVSVGSNFGVYQDGKQIASIHRHLVSLSPTYDVYINNDNSSLNRELIIGLVVAFDQKS